MSHYSEDYTIGNRKDKKLDSGLKVQPPVMYAKQMAAKNKYFEAFEVESRNSDTLNEVIKDMIAREKLGIKKYPSKACPECGDGFMYDDDFGYSGVRICSNCNYQQ